MSRRNKRLYSGERGEPEILASRETSSAESIGKKTREDLRNLVIRRGRSSLSSTSDKDRRTRIVARPAGD